MTNSERFVFWIAERLGVKIVFRETLLAEEKEHNVTLESLAQSEDELIDIRNCNIQLVTIIETQFNDARMMTHSSMPNRETEAWWGGVVYACANIYEKLGKDVPFDISNMMTKLSRVFVG